MNAKTLCGLAMVTALVLFSGSMAPAKGGVPVASVESVQKETGPNDFRISDMGTEGDTTRSAQSPRVAYNSADDEYFVVWHGDDDVDNKFEIFGQRIDATTGQEIGSDISISANGPAADADYDTGLPDVAYNSTDNEYLVVWHGDDDTLPLVNDENEIWGQRINAATGAKIGGNFRISNVQGDGNANFDAFLATVAYDPTNNRYLVVWSGDDDASGADEIQGQLLNAATGGAIGGDFRISDMGANDNDSTFNGENPQVVFNTVAGQYLVIWTGDDDTGSLVEGEFEIWGQRVSALGAEVGGDFRISFTGADGNPALDAINSALAYNPDDNEYLAVWSADPDTDQDFEVYVQRLAGASASLIGGAIQISDFGVPGETTFLPGFPEVAYSSVRGVYLAVWHSDTEEPPFIDNQFDIYGQLLDGATGTPAGRDDFRLSSMGPGGGAFDGNNAAVAASGSIAEFLVVWQGDDDGLGDQQFEIWGQRIDASALEFFIGSLMPVPLQKILAMEVPLANFRRASR